MDYRLLPLYFIVGGVVVTLATYFGSQSKGLLAAFVALFPSVTILSLFLVYQHSGVENVVGYARGLLYLLPAWVVYMGTILYLVPRFGFYLPVSLGVVLYIGIGYLINRFTGG